MDRRAFLKSVAGAGALATPGGLPTPAISLAQTDEGESVMALYELRTYTLYVGNMAEATKLYQELGFPALKKGGHDNKLLGYFQAQQCVRSANVT